MSDPIITDEPQYLSFLEDVRDRIQHTQIRVVKSANRELIELYWSLGQLIVEKQEAFGWGKSVVEQLATDLRSGDHGRRGFSAQNLWYMRQFYNAYRQDPILQQLVGEIPWGQNLIILSKVKSRDARHYYLKATQEMGWTRAVLIHNIQSKSYEQHGLVNKQHNFQQALPKHQAEQADQAIKDVYLLDMLGVEAPILEAELESRIVAKIRDVMLALGYGFAFIGNQYRIRANDTDYYIDLLFSNRRLNSLVAVELKVGRFKPEYAGKMNFYLNLLDDFVREPHENPSIGIILCTERNYFEVEYALRGLDKPVGVSEYVLTHELPSSLEDKLPDAEQLRKRIQQELGDMDLFDADTE